MKRVERRIRNSNSYNTELHTPEQNFWYLNSDLYQALYSGNLVNQVRILLTSGDYMMLAEAFSGITDSELQMDQDDLCPHPGAILSHVSSWAR